MNLDIYNWLEEALSSDQPSKYFEEIKDKPKLHEWFPELEACIHVPQSPIYHPEGDVWTHTMLVIDQAAKLRDQAQYPLYFMISALVHDYGKPTTTTIEDDGRIRSIGHEHELQLIKNAILRFSNDPLLIDYVMNMVRLHMRPNALYYMKSSSKAYQKLFKEAKYPEDLLLLAKADHTGRVNYSPYGEIEDKLRQELKCFRENND